MNRLKLIAIALTRLVIAGIFWVVVRMLYDVRIHGLEYDIGQQPAYLAMAHKRDLDPVVEVPAILAHRGWRALAGDVHFAMRGDAFSPGFLARIVRHPRWLAYLLSLIPLNWILHLLCLWPLENLHIRPGETWIRDALHLEGDARAADVLTPAYLQQIAAAGNEDYAQLRERRLSHLLSWRYHQVLSRFYGADIFARSTYSHVKSYALAKLKQELIDVAALLSKSGSLWGAPEGQLSPDGTIGPITAALHRILQVAPSDTCLVPIFIIYDFMTVRRMRIFVNLAPTIEHAPLLPTHDLDSRLRRAWLLSAHFTCTQLASGFLVQTSHAATPAFTIDDLAHAVIQQAAQHIKAGRHVDRRLLRPRKARKLARSYLKYAARHNLVRLTGPRTYVPALRDLSIQAQRGDVGYRQAPLAYAWNELQDLLSVEATPEREMLASRQTPE